MEQEEVLLRAMGLQTMACCMSGHCLSLDWRTGWAWGPEGRVYRQPCPHHDIRTSRPLKAPWGMAVPFSQSHPPCPIQSPARRKCWEDNCLP